MIPLTSDAIWIEADRQIRSAEAAVTRGALEGARRHLDLTPLSALARDPELADRWVRVRAVLALRGGVQ